MTAWSECVLGVSERSGSVRLCENGAVFTCLLASLGRFAWTLQALNCVIGRVCGVGGGGWRGRDGAGWELELWSQLAWSSSLAPPLPGCVGQSLHFSDLSALI